MFGPSTNVGIIDEELKFCSNETAAAYGAMIPPVPTTGDIV
jgi:hypothetical protein